MHYFSVKSFQYREPQRRYLFTVARPRVKAAKALPLCHAWPNVQRVEHLGAFQVLYCETTEYHLVKLMVEKFGVWPIFLINHSISNLPIILLNAWNNARINIHCFNWLKYCKKHIQRPIWNIICAFMLKYVAFKVHNFTVCIIDHFHLHKCIVFCKLESLWLYRVTLNHQVKSELKNDVTHLQLNYLPKVFHLQ